MEFGRIFWRVFFIILLIIVGWWLLGWMLKLAGWLVYAGIIAFVIAGAIFLYNRLRR
jgi:hypothetical protein